MRCQLMCMHLESTNDEAEELMNCDHLVSQIWVRAEMSSKEQVENTSANATSLSKSAMLKRNSARLFVSIFSWNSTCYKAIPENCEGLGGGSSAVQSARRLIQHPADLRYFPGPVGNPRRPLRLFHCWVLLELSPWSCSLLSLSPHGILIDPFHNSLRS